MSLYIPKMSDTPGVTIPGLADNFNFLGNRVSKEVLSFRVTDAQSVPSDTNTKITGFNRTEGDLSLVTHNGETGAFVVVSPDIKYIRVSAGVSWTAFPGGSRFLWVGKNAASLYGSLDFAISHVMGDISQHDSKNPFQFTSSLHEVTSGDELFVVVRQDSGSSLLLSNRVAVTLEVFF